MKKIMCMLFTCLVLAFPFISHAASIEQNVHNEGNYFGYGIFGQSFTATSSSLGSVKVVVGDWNTHLGNTLSLKLNVYEGSGFGGPLLASDSDTLSPGFSTGPDWWTFDLTNPANLTIGNIYTFSVESIDGTRGGIYMSNADPYLGGTAWLNGVERNGYDLAFQIPSSNTPVPEPSTVMLLGVGIAGLVVAGLRRKKID